MQEILENAKIHSLYEEFVVRQIIQRITEIQRKKRKEDIEKFKIDFEFFFKDKYPHVHLETLFENENSTLWQRSKKLAFTFTEKVKNGIKIVLKKFFI